MPDDWERGHLGENADLEALLAFSPTDDADNDGLSNYLELLSGSDPFNEDSDDDGLSDNWEQMYGLNPNSSDADGDHDGDGWNNLAEWRAGTNPSSATSVPVGIPGPNGSPPEDWAQGYLNPEDYEVSYESSSRHAGNHKTKVEYASVGNIRIPERETWHYDSYINSGSSYYRCTPYPDVPINQLFQLLQHQVFPTGNYTGLGEKVYMGLRSKWRGTFIDHMYEGESVEHDGYYLSEKASEILIRLKASEVLPEGYKIKVIPLVEKRPIVTVNGRVYNYVDKQGHPTTDINLAMEANMSALPVEEIEILPGHGASEPKTIPIPEPADQEEVRMNLLAFETLEVQEDGSLKIVSAHTMSRPIPTVDVSSFNVSTPVIGAREGGYYGLQATVSLAGIIDDALEDITPDQGPAIPGVPILSLVVNGQDEYPIALSYTKVSNTEDLRHSHDYTGTFSTSIVVNVYEGHNTFKVVARNRVSMEGYSLHSCTVEALPVATGGGTATVSVDFTSAPDEEIVDSVHVISSAHSLSLQLQETEEDSLIFSNEDGNGVLWTFYMDKEEQPWSSTESNSVTGTLVKGIPGSQQAQLIAVEETGANTLSFAFTGDLSDDFGPTMTYALHSLEFIKASLPGSFHPVLYRINIKNRPDLANKFSAKFDDSLDLSASDSDGRPAEVKTRSFVPYNEEEQNNSDYLYLSGQMSESPGLSVVVQSPAVAAADQSALDEVLAQLGPDSSFAEGFGKGFISGGVQVVQDGTALVTWAGNKAKRYWDLLWNGDVVQEIKMDAEAFCGKIGAALELAGVVLTFIGQRGIDAHEAVIDLMMGDSTGMQELGGEYADAFAMAAEVLDFAISEFANLSPGAQGALIGRLTYEVISSFAGGAATKVLQKSDFLQSLTQKPFFATTHTSGLTAKIVDFTQTLLTSKMCFVAGTPVLTQKGLRAIEAVKEGDMVWSRNEFTQNESWRSVVKTFVTHPNTLYTASLDIDNDGKGDDTVTCTGEHPFWIAELQKFLPIAEVQPGWHVMRAQGGDLVEILGLNQQRGPPGQPFTTYNFEVEDNHTYFVGKAKVWVHNSGTDCSRIAALFLKYLDKPGSKGNIGKSYNSIIQGLPSITDDFKATFVKGILDDLPNLASSGKLDSRIVRIATEKNRFSEYEAFAASRFEAKTGKTFIDRVAKQKDPISNQDLPGPDFIDDLGDKWDAVGPMPKDAFTNPTRVNSFFEAIDYHIDVMEKENPFIDLAGLPPSIKTRALATVQAKLLNPSQIQTGVELILANGKKILILDD